MIRRKIIVVQINSGLGNQMFQYAFGKSLEMQLNCRVSFDLNSDFDTPDYRKLELNPFDLRLRKASLPLLMNFKPLNEYYINLENYGCIKRIFIRIVRKFFNRFCFILLKVLNRSNTIIEENICVFKPEYFNQSNNVIYFKGYFHNELFFKTTEEEIRNNFKLKNDYLSNSNVAISIRNSNSVSIHIRRGDYLNHSIFTLLSLDYYIKAIEYIKHEVSNIRFFVFSDDIGWVKDEFSNLEEDFVFVEDKLSNNACDDLLLMSYCQHNIIANSTYSWWAAWLNSNLSKIIITPKSWYIDRTMNDSVQSNMIPEKWIRI